MRVKDKWFKELWWWVQERPVEIVGLGTLIGILIAIWVLY